MKTQYWVQERRVDRWVTVRKFMARSLVSYYVRHHRDAELRIIRIDMRILKGNR